MKTHRTAANKFCKVNPSFRKLRSQNKNSIRCVADGKHNTQQLLTSLGMVEYKDMWMQKHVTSYKLGNVGAHVTTNNDYTHITFCDQTPQPLAFIPYD